MVIGLNYAKHAMKINSIKQEVIANNIANVNTSGYKRSDIVVEDFGKIIKDKLKEQQEVKQFDITREDKTKIVESYTDFSEGTLIKTENPLDLAVRGNNTFFMIHRANDIVLTRSGNFSVDEYGNIVDNNGNFLVGSKGPINIVGKNVEITENGEVYVDNNFVDRIVLAYVENPEKHLSKIGNNYFKFDSIKNIHNPKNIKLKIGYLESSNVNPIDEMVKMIENQRYFSINEKSISAIDSTLSTLFNKVTGA